MRRNKYLALLMQQPADWIRASMADPSPTMTSMHIALHAIALRRMKM